MDSKIYAKGMSVDEETIKTALRRAEFYATSNFRQAL
jgi:hypothetical protein